MTISRRISVLFSGARLVWDLRLSFLQGVLLGLLVILCIIFAPDKSLEFIYTEF